jgi:release factor glutamine methyltransferase
VLHLAGITSARLDAELLLAHVLEQSREWCLAHDDQPLSAAQLRQLDQLLTRRLNREPIAYILGRKEFYSRDFLVTPDVLIPRPETEQLVESVESLLAEDSKIIDVGCGSGCIGITLKLECPTSNVTLSDISQSALAVANTNAARLGAEVEIVQSDLLDNISGRFDIIVANLPYVDRNWPVSPETKFEPPAALFAPDSGLALVKRLIVTAPQHLTPSGYLVLEFDPRQLVEIEKCCKKYNTNIIKKCPFMSVLKPHRPD